MAHWKDEHYLLTFDRGDAIRLLVLSFPIPILCVWSDGCIFSKPNFGGHTSLPRGVTWQSTLHYQQNDTPPVLASNST